MEHGLLGLFNLPHKILNSQGFGYEKHMRVVILYLAGSL